MSGHRNDNQQASIEDGLLEPDQEFDPVFLLWLTHFAGRNQDRLDAQLFSDGSLAAAAYSAGAASRQAEIDELKSEIDELESENSLLNAKLDLEFGPR